MDLQTALLCMLPTGNTAETPPFCIGFEKAVHVHEHVNVHENVDVIVDVDGF